MALVFVGAFPHSRPLGPSNQACPRCQGPRVIERRWHTLYLFLMPLFTLRTRVVAVCPRCQIEESTAAPAGSAHPGVPWIHRFGWVLPIGAGAVFLASLIIPEQLRRRAQAELMSTPGGRVIENELREARNGGCSGSPAALEKEACDLMTALHNKLGTESGSASVRVTGFGKSSEVVLATVQSIPIQRKGSELALDAAKLARDHLAKKLEPGKTLAVIIGDFKDPRAFVVGKVGSAFQEGSGDRVDLAPLAALIPQ